MPTRVLSNGRAQCLSPLSRKDRAGNGQFWGDWDQVADDLTAHLRTAGATGLVGGEIFRQL
jgi:hypothetical protein